MAEVPKIRVMISSRSAADGFPGHPLAQLRTALKLRIESLTLEGRPVFDVWIHEDGPAPTGGRSILQGSIDKIAWADIVLVLYTGEAGSADGNIGIGICHEELREALARRRTAVTVVELAPIRSPRTASDKNFQSCVLQQRSIDDRATDEAALLEKAMQLVHDRMARLAKRGAAKNARRCDQGATLDWTHMGLEQRKARMRDALVSALGGDLPKTNHVFDGATPALLHIAEAIPAALSVAAAREPVGQPFLRDHEYHDELTNTGGIGPLHVLACHRSVTESQALRMLGTADAIAVTSDFGVFVADRVSQVQIALFANCLDEGAVQSAVRHWREWLETSDESIALHRRAGARRNIVAAIAAGQQADG